MSALKDYVQASFQELMHKVSWPTWSELQSSSIIVFVASLIISLIIAGMDFVSKEGMMGLYKLF